VIGAEAHVCVLQTALDLRAAGKEVFLVADAVSSRSPRDVELAVERMRADEVRIVSREMVAFEWLHQAGDDRFRAISREFLR
jgi:nicotinamidase-related amidase